MRVIPPTTGTSPSISAAMLTSTTVIETAPAAYNGATVYALAAEVSDRAANRYILYESLAGGNVGNNPSVSPLFWKLRGYTYPVYAGGTSWNLDDFVIDPATHRTFKSLVGANLGNPLTDDTKWEDVGATARWAPWDILRNTGAVGSSPMTYVITPGMRIDAVGLAGIVAHSVTLTIKVAGITQYTDTQLLSYRNTLTWSDYAFGAFKYRATAQWFNLPQYAAAEVTITLTRTDGGLCTLGSAFINKSTFLGDVEPSGALASRNFSTIDRFPTGEIILIPRRQIPTSSQKLFAEKTFVPGIVEIQKLLDAVPAFWSGLDDVTDEYFEPFVFVGIYTRLDLIPENPWVRVMLDLEET